MSEFRCDIEPRSEGGWRVWIYEKPYRGVATDAALERWKRQRSGGAWSQRHLVGRRLTRVGAQFAARRALRIAVRQADRNAREIAKWQQRRTQRFTLTREYDR